MKSKLYVILSALALTLTLTVTGCGVVEDPETAKFESDIQAFCDEVAAIDANINNIDATSEHADEELLEYLDQLDQSFKVLAEMPIPEEYAYLEELTDEASAYMSTAVESYHEAFAGDTYDANIADYAYQNYERMTREPKLEILIRLADLYGVSLDYLTGRTDEK